MKFVLIIAGLLIGGAVASPAVKDNVNALTVQRIQNLNYRIASIGKIIEVENGGTPADLKNLVNNAIKAVQQAIIRIGSPDALINVDVSTKDLAEFIDHRVPKLQPLVDNLLDIAHDAKNGDLYLIYQLGLSLLQLRVRIELSLNLVDIL